MFKVPTLCKVSLWSRSPPKRGSKRVKRAALFVSAFVASGRSVELEKPTKSRACGMMPSCAITCSRCVRGGGVWVLLSSFSQGRCSGTPPLVVFLMRKETIAASLSLLSILMRKVLGTASTSFRIQGMPFGLAGKWRARYICTYTV